LRQDHLHQHSPLRGVWANGCATASEEWSSAKAHQPPQLLVLDMHWVELSIMWDGKFDMGGISKYYWGNLVDVIIWFEHQVAYFEVPSDGELTSHLPAFLLYATW
jgi:hypothetical protein